MRKHIAKALSAEKIRKDLKISKEDIKIAKEVINKRREA